MTYRPLPHPVEVPAHMLRIQFWPRKRISFNHIEREQSNVSVALCVQAEDFDAVIWT